MVLSREQLLTAVEENPEGIWKTYINHLPGGVYKRTGALRLMCSQVPVSFFNGIAMTRLEEEECDQALESAIAEMVATGMPWSYQVGPNCQPDDLDVRLQNQGLKYSHDIPSMARTLRNWQPGPVPTNLAIQEVNDAETYKVFIQAASEAFSLPDSVSQAFSTAQNAIGYEKDSEIRNFIALENGAAVATGSVYYSAGIAGIYTIGTLAAARGKGYGAAITEACTYHAIQKGIDTVFLQSSKMGYTVYQRLGFQEICRFKIYIPGP